MAGLAPAGPHNSTHMGWLPGALFVENTTSVQAIGTVAFSAGLQFLPGIVAILYWPQGNKKGFLAGLLSGVAIWLGFLLIPSAMIRRLL